MTDFIMAKPQVHKKLPYDLSSHTGLALIDQYLKSTKLKSLIDSGFPIRAGIANSDVLKSYITLLSLGRNDFDAIENFGLIAPVAPVDPRDARPPKPRISPGWSTTAILPRNTADSDTFLNLGISIKNGVARLAISRKASQPSRNGFPR